jgi:hypothetical protein
MGLDLYCGKESWGSSYSGVHIIREWFIKATIKYMENLDCSKNNNQTLVTYQPLEQYRFTCNYDKDKNNVDLDSDVWNKKDLLEFLNSLVVKELPQLPKQISWMTPLKIIYDPWGKTPFELAYFGLHGLQVFVNHSDCDGFFTVGQAYDILGLLSRIGNDLFELEEVKEEGDKEWILDLIKLLEHCVKIKEDIRFC